MPRKITTGVVGGQILGTLSTATNTVTSRETNENIVFTPDGTGVTQFTKDLYTSSNTGIRLGDNDTNYALLKAPSALASNYTLTLPADDGTNNQVLSTNGSGVLSWADSGVTVTNRTSADSSTYYLAMTNATSGIATNVNVSDSSRLEFIPNPGKLTVNQIAIQATTASSTTTTGALTVAGGVGVAGQLTATTLVETSSIALKENIQPIENALDKITQLVGVVYDRKDGSSKNEPGLVAEDVNKIIPELVTENSDGVYYTKISAYLIEAIKTLKDEIDILKKQK